MKNKEGKKREARKNETRVVRTEEATREQSGRAEDGKEEKGGKAEAQGRGERNAMKKRAFITIVIIQAVLTFNYSPFIIILPMRGVFPDATLKCQFLPVALAAASCCSYLQPLLHLHRLGRLPCRAPRVT